MVLVPLHIREELKCLLNFMRVAAEEDSVKLSVKVSINAVPYIHTYYIVILLSTDP